MAIPLWWAKLCEIHDSIKETNENVTALRHELKEFRTMTDSRLSNLDTELDNEDTALNQLQQDGQDALTQIKQLQQQEAELQTKVTDGTASIDDQAELVRIQGDTQRLVNMHNAIQMQLNPPSEANNPNTGLPNSNPNGSSPSTISPQPINSSGTAPNPAVGQTSVDGTADLGAGPGAATTVDTTGTDGAAVVNP